MKFFGSSAWSGPLPEDSQEVMIEGMKGTALTHQGGMLLAGNDGKYVSEFL